MRQNKMRLNMTMVELRDIYNTVGLVRNPCHQMRQKRAVMPIRKSIFVKKWSFMNIFQSNNWNNDNIDLEKQKVVSVI